ncbi:FAD-dependent monooxygenase [Gordonia terrae]|uniref:Monooxygenase n=2 Tax=Gordonia terrae TaxID=2055 RepID=A0AAD0NXK4_9ACTN|nr:MULTISPECIES: FAD-dependent monooxygenase [Gordonia]VTR08544.1 Kynurenine 3-monooxygenase [Clostridioides difficile]ANY25588.1 hypothetical protein BCM27_24740 [Gordonia terrae]AWO86331.1 monooxygenase [Gordonia terrae]VTS64024.1 Kynurenine 3-monooxygenase [Gordonia terrae]GAB44223.1 putative oxidoreductase [Gordonia terrae NBRC 100016]
MRVLISGGSVAGLTAAALLSRDGHEVTLLERASGPRQGGVAVDVRGQALDVARSLGLHDLLLDHRVGYEDRFSFVDRAGVPQALVTPNTDVYDSPDDIEISRDRLVDILSDAVPRGVTTSYGSWIEKLEDEGSHVTVEIRGADTRREEFDLVIGADGLHSGVRRLAFGPEHRFVRHLGLYVGVIRSCSTDLGVRDTTVYNEPGRMVMVRGDGREQSAILGYRSPLIDYDYRDVDAHRRMLTRAFTGDTGWKFGEIRDEIASTPDLYFDAVSQTVMDSWTTGRVALIGDAGYCASFFSGMGTTLAMTGAAALAHALAVETTVSAALDAYCSTMRPVVDAAHALAGEGADILFPTTEEDITLRNRRYALKV